MNLQIYFSSFKNQWIMEVKIHRLRTENFTIRCDDTNEEAVENYLEMNCLNLIQDPKLPSSFNSSRWRRGYNPDIFAGNNIRNTTIKVVLDPIPKSSTGKILYEIKTVIVLRTVLSWIKFSLGKQGRENLQIIW